MLLYIAAAQLRAALHSIPLALCTAVPFAHSVFSAASLFAFVQALVLLALTCVPLASTLSIRIARAAVGVAGGAKGGAAVLLEQPLRTLALCYAYYCVMRMIFFIAVAMWTVTWELYHDFPTVRRMLVGRTRLAAAAATATGGNAASEGADAAAQAAGGARSAAAAAAASASSGGSAGREREVSAATASAPAPAAVNGGAPTSSFPVAASGGVAARSGAATRRRTWARTASCCDDGPIAAREEETTEDGDAAVDLLAQKASARRELRRAIALVAPLVIQFLLSVALAVGEFWCLRGAGEGHDFCVASGLFDRKGLFNDTLNFIVFLHLLQVGVVWVHFFPSWHKVLLRECECGDSGARLLKYSLLLALLPCSITQLAYWFAGDRPDVAPLLAAWSLWLLVAPFVILKSASTDLSGFAFSKLTDSKKWRGFCTLQKYTATVWLLGRLVRDCFSIGVAEAQTNLINAVILYPMLWCAVWTATYVGVAVSRYVRRIGPVMAASISGAAALLVVAWAICSLIGRDDLPLLIAFVWLHLTRQSFRVARALLRRWTRRGQSAVTTPGGSAVELTPGGSAAPAGSGSGDTTVRFALSQDGRSPGQSPARAHGPDTRKIIQESFMILILIALSFCMILAACVALAFAEQSAERSKDPAMYWASTPGRVHMWRGNTTILDLRGPGADNETGATRGDASVAVLPPGQQPHYAVCGYRWHDLDVVDFSMLSLVPYLRHMEGADVPGLLRALLPHRKTTVRKTSDTFRAWLEVEVESCDLGDQGAGGPSLRGTTGGGSGSRQCRTVSVVAVSGTDPSRATDILECLRMWTEPVTLQIAAVFFPTVRLWPRDTTAMVIGSIFRFLKWLGIQDDQWHYKDILDHVRQLPADREVVITGHSLGGGIALVVGALTGHQELTGHQAVAIQPPGLYHALAKHEEQHGKAGRGRHLHKRSLSLVVEHDFISYFDGHGGLVQTVLCDRPSESATLGCHRLEGTVCHLLQECGDHAGRFQSCALDDAAGAAAAAAAAESGSRTPRARLRELLDVADASWRSYLLVAERNMASLLLAGVVVSVFVLVQHYANLWEKLPGRGAAQSAT